MRLIQFTDIKHNTNVGVVDGDKIIPLKKTGSVYDHFQECLRLKLTLRQYAETASKGESVHYDALIREKRIKIPVHHPDPYHTWISGTGLTHLGSAASRDAMHKKKVKKDVDLTDSMKMFRMGIDHGRMKGKKPGVQPEWFYKGNGLMVVDPEKDLVSPDFAMDGGEEPEIAGIYINDHKGNPHRVGFALGNEFSDHVMERINYLYLAHSKLRNCAYGPELLLDPLPGSVEGQSRIRRGKKVIWAKPFLSGEQNMSHDIANLEHHHFKYDLFRQPGDVHVHFFGTAVLSFSDQVKLKSGDVFEIESGVFGRPLRNRLSK